MPNDNNAELDTPTTPGLWASRAAAARKAVLASAATFIGTFLLLTATALALLGPIWLQPAGIVGGPSLACVLVRPGLVFSGLTAVLVLAAIVIDTARKEKAARPHRGL